MCQLQSLEEHGERCCPAWGRTLLIGAAGELLLDKALPRAVPAAPIRQRLCPELHHPEPSCGPWVLGGGPGCPPSSSWGSVQCPHGLWGRGAHGSQEIHVSIQGSPDSSDDGEIGGFPPEIYFLPMPDLCAAAAAGSRIRPQREGGSLLLSRASRWRQPQPLIVVPQKGQSHLAAATLPPPQLHNLTCVFSPPSAPV